MTAFLFLAVLAALILLGMPIGFAMARAATAVAGLPHRRVLTAPDAAVRTRRSLIAA